MSILDKIQETVAPREPTAPHNPWASLTREDLLRVVRDRTQNAATDSVRRLKRICEEFYALAWTGKDLAGRSTGLTPVEFFTILGSEGAALVDAFGLFAQGVNRVAPGTLPSDPVMVMHRLPSGWVWPGDLKDKPEGWGV